MIRKIIHIDEEKCDGCGACVNACHEGAIDLINGKAKLMREHYCDGLGDCLPACHAGAITFEEREAPAYDEAAVKAAQAAKKQPVHTGCPGAAMRQMLRRPAAPSPAAQDAQSQLVNWPVQIKLAPVRAPYFEDAALLIAADWHRLCLRGVSQPLPRRPCLPDRLSETRRRRLQREAHRDSARQLHPFGHDRAHGGPLLRRAGDGRKARPPAEWEVPPVARRDRPHRRQHHRRLKQITPEGLCPSGVREFRCAPRLAPP